MIRGDWYGQDSGTDVSVRATHLLANYNYSIPFWKDFELYYLSLTQQQIHLNLKDILIGLSTPELPLLNYLLLIGTIYLWACRRNKELPSIRGFKSKVKL